ncbi:MAG: lipopolysaccharide heptosyltransferase family protein, partial [Synechococcales cyanobacterium RU_4_20]|nr:lipopolysaccharide heptosyltransferase family protein [Synechococcales cyanobacterium RU_4_20]
MTQVLAPKADQYQAQTYYDLLQGIDIEGTCPEVSISVPRKDINWAEAEQKRLGVPGGYLLIDGRTEAQETNPYPLSSWRLVLREIRDRQPELPLVVVQDEDSTFAASLKEDAIELKVSLP